MSDEQERELRKWKQGKKLKWHELLISDPELHKGAAALAFAALLLHRYDVDRGYAEVSVAYAVAKLGMPKTTVHRGRRQLRARGWIAIWTPPHERKRRLPDLPQRYTLAGGPDDLILDDLGSATNDTPATDDIPD